MEREKLQELIFVYNAASGWGNLLLDGAHKILKPDTYSCDLCQLTHGAFRERGVWKDFRQSSQVPMQFLYKDEFLKDYASKFRHTHTFPVILGRTGSGLELVVSSEELQDLETAVELIRLLKART